MEQNKKYTNMERNKLDYLLTDLLPVEISELFSYRYFYDFLLDEQKVLDNIISDLQKSKGNINTCRVLFENGWDSMPLKIDITKTKDTFREINVLQPISALNIYYFIQLYQKDILNYLDENNIFSLRYHKKNSSLYYKQKQKLFIHYFSAIAKSLRKSAVEQTGAFFNIGKYNSVHGFTSSKDWQRLCSKYKYFAKIDYKSCFDSIYTHAYKWIVSKDVVDSKNFANNNLFTVIDRILQNINAKSSNGVVVGPEFSRMIAEILLQTIDKIIFDKLHLENLNNGIDYNVFRYVDDVFIFADKEETIDKIILEYAKTSSEFLLKINEQKEIKSKLPFSMNSWFKSASELSKDLSDSFYSEKEIKENEITYLLKDGKGIKDSVKTNFYQLICDKPENTRTIVSYVLGTVLNQVERKKKGYTVFKAECPNNKIEMFLDFVFYIHSFFPSFDNTSKLISIISYAHDELELRESNALQKCINEYSFIFKSWNIVDLVNILNLSAKCKIQIPTVYEDIIFKKIKENDDPILYANFLVYSRYNNSYFQKILAETSNILKSKLNSIIVDTKYFLYREFWYVLIFNKCPWIDSQIQQQIDLIISKLNGTTAVATSPTSTPIASSRTTMLIHKFMTNNDLQFFCWDIANIDLLKQMAYRTQQRTIFKKFKNRDGVFETSF